MRAQTQREPQRQAGHHHRPQLQGSVKGEGRRLPQNPDSRLQRELGQGQEPGGGSDFAVHQRASGGHRAGARLRGLGHLDLQVAEPHPGRAGSQQHVYEPGKCGQRTDTRAQQQTVYGKVHQDLHPERRERVSAAPGKLRHRCSCHREADCRIQQQPSATQLAGSQQ